MPPDNVGSLQLHRSPHQKLWKLKDWLHRSLSCLLGKEVLPAWVSRAQEEAVKAFFLFIIIYVEV